MATMDSRLSIPPLDGRRFNLSFAHFCSSKRMVLDREALRVRGIEVNLHSVHEQVMNHRAYDALKVHGFSLHSLTDGVLNAMFLERERVLGENRHAAWVHPFARHGIHLFGGS